MVFFIHIIFEVIGEVAVVVVGYWLWHIAGSGGVDRFVRGGSYNSCRTAIVKVVVVLGVVVVPLLQLLQLPPLIIKQ